MAERSKAKIKIPGFLKPDPRLIGTWKSDKRRTFSEWSWKKNTSPRRKEALRSRFGKHELTFTRSRLVSKLPHRKWETAQQYCVLATDETSVAILQFGELEIKNRHKYWELGLAMVEQWMSQPQIMHLHFDKKHFWISIGNGRCREFYRRIRTR
jgi:hypothetical protein